MAKSKEHQLVEAFNQCIAEGNLDGAFELMTEDVTFRPIGTHPELGREFKGKQDILENCWLKVFEHVDLSHGTIQLTTKNIVTADGIAFRQSSGSGVGRSGMPYNNEYVHVYLFRGDKICSVTEYLDTDLLYKLMEQ